MQDNPTLVLSDFDGGDSEGGLEEDGKKKRICIWGELHKKTGKKKMS